MFLMEIIQCIQKKIIVTFKKGGNPFNTHDKCYMRLKTIYYKLYLNILINFLNKKLTLFLLVIISSSIFLLNYYWLSPQLEKANNQRQAIIARKYAQLNNLNNEKIMNILLSLAKINHSGLWIDSIQIKDNDINLKIRSFDTKNIEEYIYEIVELNQLQLVRIQTRNIKYKNTNSSGQEENKAEPIPFAVKIYLESIKRDSKNNQNNDSDDEEASEQDKVFFTYESDIQLRAQGQ